MNPENYCICRKHSLLGQNYEATIKQLWAPENIENISNFEGWGLTLVAYRKSIVSYHFNFYVVHACFDKQHFHKQRQAEISKQIKQMLNNTLRLNFCYYWHSSFTLLSKNNKTYSKKKKKKMCVCICEIIYLIIVKMLMKLKNWSHRHDINSPRSRQIVNIRIVSAWWCLHVLRNT